MTVVNNPSKVGELTLTTMVAFTSAGLTQKPGLKHPSDPGNPATNHSRESRSWLLQIQPVGVAPKEVCTPPEEHGRDRDPQGKADGCDQGQPVQVGGCLVRNAGPYRSTIYVGLPWVVSLGETIITVDESGGPFVDTLIHPREYFLSINPGHKYQPSQISHSKFHRYP